MITTGNVNPMTPLKVIRARYRQANEHVGAFLDKHQKAEAYGVIGTGMAVGAVSLLTGNVSAAVTGTANIGYGVSMIDVALIGGIALVGGMIIRHPLALAAGLVFIAGGAVANVLGY
jgi:hypothetical protein